MDDGSTDNTKKIVDEWKKEDCLQIQYHFQKNQGMHGAHNTAYKLIKTELNVCIDSDDYMPDDAVETIINYWKQYGNGNESVGGIIGLDSFTDRKIIGSKLPTNLKTSTLFNLYLKHGVTGDKKLVYRSELTKKYPYPVFEGEKYVGLAYKYYKLDQEYEMLLLNKVLCCVEYLPDGSSKNMLKQYRKNPQGFSFYRKELMKLSIASLSFKYKQAIHYVSSSVMMRNWKFIRESPNKGLTILALPLGLLLFTYVTSKTRDVMY